jgi:hypothetical protein
MTYRKLILDGSPCDTNFHDDGPRTVKAAKAEGRQLCPHFDKCNSGGLDPNRQCEIKFGVMVAQEALKGRSSVQREMDDFRRMGPKPRDFYWSEDRKEFETLDYEKGLVKIASFATAVLGRLGEEGDKVGSSFEDVVGASMVETKGGGVAIDLGKMQEFEGRFGHNGGRGCDVRSGPCSCGAWH